MYNQSVRDVMDNMLLNEKFDFSEHDYLEIAIISDTHSDIDESVIEFVKTCDIAIHAGDIGNMDVLKAMQPKTSHVIAVSGNNDKPYLWEVKDWHVVRNLPQTVQLKLPGGVLTIEHGHEHDMKKPCHDDLRNTHEQSRMIVYGHTHKQVIDDSHDSICVVNPGAAGYTRTHGGSACLKLIVDKASDDWKLEAFRFSEDEKLAS